MTSKPNFEYKNFCGSDGKCNALCGVGCRYFSTPVQIVSFKSEDFEFCRFFKRDGWECGCIDAREEAGVK